MSTAVSDKEMLIDIVARHAETRPDDRAFSYLRDGESDAVSITYAQLQRRARAVAAEIRMRAGPGARVLLLTPPGLDFVVGVLACLCAGAVAVPTLANGTLRPARMIDHVRRLVADAGTSVALTSDLRSARSIVEEAPDLAGIHWLALAEVSDAAAAQWRRPDMRADDLALLQYTSGSTHHPKGVMINQSNLLANLNFLHKIVCRGFAVEGVMWVPPYHDMGLVGGILLALYNPHHVTLMSPAHFLQRPMRWLEALSRSHATHTAAPNFALDLCVRRTTPEQRAALDLSSVRMLLCGGEPIRADTFARFTEAFSPAGFRSSAFTPAYGLAEATLMATSTSVRRAAHVKTFDAAALRTGAAVPAKNGAGSISLVGCGKPAPLSRVLIADPEGGQGLPPGRIGEILLSGPNLTPGYWNRPEETRLLLTEVAGRRFLRSGDLGFMHDGQLFVVGRSRDLIIINGQNHQPQDIEETVEAADAPLVPQGCAAFSLTAGAEERLTVVAEIRAGTQGGYGEVLHTLRRAIAARHDLPLCRLALIRKHGLPKTTSGKVRRGETCRMLLAGELPVLFAWELTASGNGGATAAQNGKRAGALAWLREETARLTGEPADAVRPEHLLSEAGLTSLQIAELVHRAEIQFGEALQLAELPPDVSFQDLVELIEEPSHPPRSSVEPSGRATGRTRGNGHASPLAAMEPLRRRLQELADLGLDNPYFSLHDGTACATTHVGGRELINFASYNYLGFSGHPAVNEAAKRAIDAMGTSVSASRLVSGDRPVHRDLERALAKLIGVEVAIVFVSGNLTNVTILGHLAGPEDLVIRDALAHDSILQGAKLSGAAHRAFPHNDWRALDNLLTAVGDRYRQVFVAIEGVYSMDGDIPDLQRFVEVKQRHGAWLMVDEAHSIGVLGRHGRGIAEHAGVNATDVDLWMGTLSKTFASCGGYIAGSTMLIEYLKYTAPGFVFSVGLPPPSAAAALMAVQQLVREPQRVTRLQERARLFLDLARAAGLDTGNSSGSAVVPVILGASLKTIACASRLRERGINAQPVVHPAVEEHAARLRFFICADHTAEQISETVATVTSVIGELADMPTSQAGLPERVPPLGAHS